MRIIVTAGPSYEPLDQVRRLTNFSTGRLGTTLANYWAERGADVTLLLGEQATWQGPVHARHVLHFSTGGSLAEHLDRLSAIRPDAVFHAAAVGDFTFGKVWQRDAEGRLTEVSEGKISSRASGLLAELVPAPKIIVRLRQWFPEAFLVGWKYEVDGPKDRVVGLARRQMTECRTDGCVVNGAGYGAGFGFATPENCIHCENSEALFSLFSNRLSKRGGPGQS